LELTAAAAAALTPIDAASAFLDLQVVRVLWIHIKTLL
jgi:hypothetical protein